MQPLLLQQCKERLSNEFTEPGTGLLLNRKLPGGEWKGYGDAVWRSSLALVAVALEGDEPFSMHLLQAVSSSWCDGLPVNHPSRSNFSRDAFMVVLAGCFLVFHQATFGDQIKELAVSLVSRFVDVLVNHQAQFGPSPSEIGYLEPIDQFVLWELCQAMEIRAAWYPLFVKDLAVKVAFEVTGNVQQLMQADLSARLTGMEIEGNQIPSRVGRFLANQAVQRNLQSPSADRAVREEDSFAVFVRPFRNIDALIDRSGSTLSHEYIVNSIEKQLRTELTAKLIRTLERFAVDFGPSVGVRSLPAETVSSLASSVMKVIFQPLLESFTISGIKLHDFLHSLKEDTFSVVGRMVQQTANQISTESNDDVHHLSWALYSLHLIDQDRFKRYILAGVDHMMTVVHFRSWLSFPVVLRLIWAAHAIKGNNNEFSSLLPLLESWNDDVEHSTYFWERANQKGNMFGHQIEVAPISYPVLYQLFQNLKR